MAKLGPELARIFRITHIDNVPWILKHGLHCQNSSTKDPKFIPIGMAELIDKRKRRRVDMSPGGTLADYVPFYFTPFSIMMYHIKTGYGGVTKRPNGEIVILVSSLPKLKQVGVRFLFTDGHAYPIETDYYDDLKDLDKIDWPLLQSRNFRTDPEDPGKTTRYQAEALIHRHVPVSALIGIACYDEAARLKVSRAAGTTGVSVDVRALSHFYF
jgi:hypothetical protein